MKRQVCISIAVILFLVPLILLPQDKYTIEYKIGARDLLDIIVFGLNELNRTVKVSEDGKIALPLIGEVDVNGLTRSEVEQKLAKLLEEKYLQNAQVTVFIREYQSKKISLIGAIARPGQYELVGRQTLLHIITAAGGLTNEAGKELFVIREQPDGTNTSLGISIEDLIQKGDAKLNIPLEPNDIVNIPVDKMVSIYIMGQVRNPGALQVRISQIPSLQMAIAQAGGFMERAKKSGIIIKRIDETGKEIKIVVNFNDIVKGKKKDIRLMANDVIIVPETFF